MKKKFFCVKIYYGGDRPILEYFHTAKEAMEFYESHDLCDPPQEWVAEGDDIRHAEFRINMRLIGEEFKRTEKQ